MKNEDLVPKLTSSITKKHKKFLKEVGDIPYKYSADHFLLLTQVTSKIVLVATVLKDVGVIDGFEIKNFSEYNSIVLSKKGLDFKTEIVTDGKGICIKTAGVLIDMDGLAVYKQWFLKDKDGEWNWDRFANELLDFIHSCMYKGLEIGNKGEE